MRKVLIILGLLAQTVNVAIAADLRQVTSDLPPFSFLDGGTARGSVYDVLKEAHRRLGWPFQPRFQPWARAQATALGESETEIFGLARAPEREHLYKWIALVYVAQNTFVRLGDTAVPVTLQTARQLPYVGVEMNSAMSSFLQQRGFSNLSTIPSDPLCLHMLMTKHISAWFTFEERAKYLLRAEGYHGKLVFGPPVQQVGLWLAANPDFSEQRANALRRVLAGMKADGSYARIVARYQ